jgi:hypothetical protein
LKRIVSLQFFLLLNPLGRANRWDKEKDKMRYISSFDLLFGWGAFRRKREVGR